MDRSALALLAAALLAPAATVGQSPGETVSPPAGPARPADPAPGATGPADPPAEGAPGGDAAKIDPPALPQRSSRPVDKDAKPVPRGAILEDVSGVVSAVDRQAHTIAVDTPSGAVTLKMDRNTLVYGPRGLASVLDVQPGAQVRAGRNAEFVAYWVTVRAPRQQEPALKPGQGTGPGGSSAPPSEATGGGTPSPATPPSTVGPGSATPGGTPTGAGGAGR